MSCFKSNNSKLYCKSNTGFVTPVRPILKDLQCTFGDATYKYYNVGGADAARAYSCADDNKVWLNNANTLLGDIDEQQGIEFNLAPFDIIYSCKPLAIAGEEGTSGIGIYSDKYKGTTLATNASRYGGVDLNIYSLGATSADIYRNGALVNTIALTPNTGTIFTQTGNYTGVWTVVANGEILGYKREDNAGNGDPQPMMPLSNSIVGWASTIAYISNSFGVSTNFTTESHLGTYTGVTGTTYNIVNSVDLPHSSAQDNYYDIFVAIHTTSTDSLTASSRADSDGGSNTPHIPVDLLCDTHIIPEPTEFVSFMNENGSPVQVFDNGGNLITTVTPTRVNNNAWYSERIGLPNGATNFAAGLKLVSSEPINVVYQPKGAGSYGSDDDELVSEGCCTI